MRATFVMPGRRRPVSLKSVAWAGVLLALCAPADGQAPNGAAAWYGAPGMDLVFEDAAAASPHSEWHFDRSDSGDIRIQKSERRAGAALSGTVISYCDDRALLVGGIVPRRDHAAEEFEQPVLSLQLALRLLSRAFPQGPGSVSAAVERDLNEEQHPLRARMARSVDAAGNAPLREVPAPWRAHISAAPAAAGAVDFSIDLSSAGGPLHWQGRWLPQSRMAALPPALDLLGWKVYRAEIQAAENGGTVQITSRLQPQALRFANLGALRTRIESNWSNNPAAAHSSSCGPDSAPDTSPRSGVISIPRNP